MQNYIKTWSQAQRLEMTVLGVVWTVPASLVAHSGRAAALQGINGKEPSRGEGRWTHLEELG